ncbi:MAG: FtsX-like permease family protein [Bacteroidota bacterium]
MKILKLAYKNIIHSPLNLLLSIILFGLGIGLINFLFLFNAQLKTKFDSNLADIDLVIGAKGSPLQMILSSMYHIDNPTGNISIEECKAFLNPKHPLIKAAVPLSLGDSYRSYRIIGSTDSLMSFYGAELQQGKIHAKDFEVTIGRAVADDTGLKLGDSFVSSHGFNDDEDLAHDHAAFKVVGILKGTGNVIDQLLITNPSTVWNVHDHEGHDHQDHEGHDHGDHEGHDHGDHEGHDHGDHEGHDHGDHEGHDYGDHEGHDHVDHEGHDHGDHEGHDHGDHEGHDHGDHEGHDHGDREGHDHGDHEGHDHGEQEDKNNSNQAVNDPSIPFARTNADLLKYPEKEITSILVKFKNRTNFQALSMPRSINDNTDMQAASPAIEINRLYSMIGVGREMVKWLAFLIAFISAVSIFIVLYKSMRERKYELALIRVMGGSRSSLFQLITFEGMLLTAIGFLVGFVLSHLGIEILAGSLKSSYKYSFSGFQFMKSELILFGVSLLIGLVAALIPAVKASKTDIHNTLTEKG